MRILPVIQRWMNRHCPAPIRGRKGEKRGENLFLDYVHGDDANDGLSPETAFLTWERMVAAVNALPPGPQRDMIIHLPGDGTERVEWK